MKIQISSLTFLFLISGLFFTSCIEDDEDGPGNNQINSSFEASDAVSGQFDASGTFVAQYVPEFELYVNGFDFYDGSNAANSEFLIGIQIYDEEEIELTTGIYSLRNSYLAGGELGNMGLGVTWWDESRNATIYSEVEQGILRIRGISETRVWGDFMFDITSPQSGEKLVVREGSFDIRR
ncbi:hypothetical protein A33Q_1488 [Indibacter alkaliphilus LW1]|uniref:Uncharacterized protein n=1 Tax=Indibacter alkaliphilus (strain CCUG 57479 / KCTC 22604 / LW1) TaxID=1189612 RepID=S2E110_INDAL|nr:hypothetical protein [Indibacter alkaliphilus]EOZ98126.1 hypothetical protein A33Q_1488 [Indibacter alkaliphilus LW1]